MVVDYREGINLSDLLANRLVELQNQSGNIKQSIFKDLNELLDDAKNKKSFNHENIWKVYEFYKREISLLCGWDNPTGSCKKYDTAIKQLTAELNI